MSPSAENVFYNAANAWVHQALAESQNGQCIQSWLSTIPARLCYIADMIVDLAALPLATIGLIVGLFYATLTCNWRQNTLLHFYYSKTTEKTNHFCVSCFGSLISPALAHKYRDFNVVPYIIIARIMVICAGLGYWAYTRF